MKYTSQRDRFTNKLKGLKQFLRKELTTRDTPATLKTVVKGVVGWINYHAISDNEKRVKQFIWQSRRIVWCWINRRGRRRPMSWKTFMKLLETINFPRKWKTTSMFA
jgi:hypothetical protein